MQFSRNLQRLTGYSAMLALAIMTAVGSAGAVEPTSATRSFTVDDFAGGGEIAINQSARIAIFRGALTAPAEVTLAVRANNLPALPKNHKALGQVYLLSVTGVDAWSPTVGRPGFMILPAAASHWSRSMWKYDLTEKKWTKLSTTLYAGRKIAVARPTSLNAYYAVLEDRRTQQGIASWYCRVSCSTRYPTLHGTSNDFPVGSTVTVKSLDTKATVKVKIVSRWGQPAGRVIDLSYAAFQKIRGTNGGLARVEVTSVSATPTVAKTQAEEPTPVADPAPKMTVSKKTTSPYPGSSVVAYSVIDEGSGTVLAEKMSTTPRSIASITKLVTAAVALDAQVQLKKWIIYASADQTPYGYLRVKPGEVLSIADTFYATLVASANNAATTLARSTGLSQPEFLRRMNAKAKELGATKTKFVDVHGLSAGNTSTTTDLATISAKILSSYPLIRQATSKKTYDFTTRNTKVSHHLVTTDKLLLNGPIPSPLQFAGGKTGYIDEAGYTYTIRFAAPNGARIVVSILGAPNAAVRYGDAAALARWAWNNYTWSG